MSAQRLALNNFLRSGPRIVTAPHHATIAVEGRDKDEEHEQHVPENVRLVEAVLPFVNFVRNVPRSIDVAQSWVPLHKFGNDSGNQSVDSCDSKTSKPLYLLDCQCDGTPTTPPPSRKNSTEKPSMTEIAVQTDERITFSGDFYANSRALKWELQNSIGEREMLDEEYDKAFERFKAAADHGCVEAMRNLAECYAHGLGCKKSHTRAFLWWDRASLGGDLEALYQSALCYLRGEGIAKSVVGGQKLMRSAADRGHPEACFYMTTLLFRENRAEEASRYVRGALEDEECETRLRKWLEMDDLSLPAQLVLHEHLRHEKDVEATVAKK